MAQPSNPQTFGRRAAPAARAPLAAPARAETVAPPWPAEEDEELRQWKATRRRPPLPWRQIYLMAGLCFGIASLVLPDDVNGAVDWLLYGLAAASFYAGWRKRHA
jgi:hypothetical protein